MVMRPRFRLATPWRDDQEARADAKRAEAFHPERGPSGIDDARDGGAASAVASGEREHPGGVHDISEMSQLSGGNFLEVGFERDAILLASVGQSHPGDGASDRAAGDEDSRGFIGEMGRGAEGRAGVSAFCFHRRVSRVFPAMTYGILVTPARLAAGVTPAPSINTERNAAAAFRGGLLWEGETFRREAVLCGFQCSGPSGSSVASEQSRIFESRAKKRALYKVPHLQSSPIGRGDEAPTSYEEMKSRHAAALALAMLLFGCSSQPRRCFCSPSDPDNCVCVPLSTYLSCKVRYPGDLLAQSRCVWPGAIYPAGAPNTDVHAAE